MIEGIATVESLKTGYDVLKEISSELGPLERLKSFLHSRKERRQMLGAFCSDFLQHKVDETYLMNYYSWLYEAREWHSGDGEVMAMSVGETKTWWSDPGLYAVYDAALTKFTDQGGVVSRIMLVEGEFFDASAQLTLLRTGYRHYRLGMEPLMLYRPDSWSVMKELGVDCDLFGVANNRIAYFNRFGEEPLCVKSYSKKIIGKAYTTYQNLRCIAKPFEEWRKGVSWGHLLNAIAEDVEREAELIREFARGA